MVFCIMIACVSRRWALCPCLRGRDEDGKSCKQDLAVLRDAFRFFLSTQVIAAGEQLSATSEQCRKSNVIVLRLPCLVVGSQECGFSLLIAEVPPVWRKWISNLVNNSTPYALHIPAPHT